MKVEFEQRKFERPRWHIIASMSLAFALAPGFYTPSQAATNRGASISGGLMHSCAVMSDRTVQCWGINNNGELGNGNTLPLSVAVAVSGIINAVAVTSGWDHTCALLADGRVQCWGANTEGQLGDGTRIGSLIPVTVSGITTAIAVGSGPRRTCAVLSNGTVQCWGVKSLEPETINGITDAVAVAGSCAILGDGRVQCWQSTSLELKTLRGITNAVSISNTGPHTCVVLADGQVQCWGNNSGGELGNGKTSSASAPVTVSGLTNAVAVATGACNYTCAVLADGHVQCWGHKLHFATSMKERKVGPSVPATVSGITNAVAVAAQDNHPCAVLADGRVQCWGLSVPGEFGDGTKSTASPPVTINELGKSAQVSDEMDR